MTIGNGRSPSVYERKRLQLAARAVQPRQAARVARLSAVARRARISEPGDLWCILRTSPGRTIALAASLNEAGIKAWTPQQTITRKRPRSSSTVERQLALAPTFVFAEAGGGREQARPPPPTPPPPPPKAENLPASLKILNLGGYSIASSKYKCWRAPGAS